MQLSLTTNKDGLVSLTDLYRQAVDAGMADGKSDPRNWSRREGEQFIEFIAENLHVAKKSIYKASKARADRGGGTFAHWQIALAYAKYLSPALHMQVNDVYARYQSADPELAGDMAERMTPEQLKRHAARVNGIKNRNEFTATLAAHSVVGQRYKDCTNAIYLQLFHGTAKELRERSGLPEKTNLRDVMSAKDLTVTAFAELLAAEMIEAANAQGNERCRIKCTNAANKVATQLRDAKGSR